MPDTLLNPAAVPGHNMPPLADLLAETTAPLAARSGELLSAVERCHVQDDDTAQRAVTLTAMLKAHAKALETKRDEHKRPYLEAGRTVDGHFKALTAPLEDAARRVTAMIDTFRRDQQRKADEDRRAQEAEAARKAQEAARLAAEAQQGDIEAEIAARRAAAEAAAATQQAQSMAGPAQIRSDYGAMATGRKATVITVTDPAAFTKHLLKTKNPELAEALDAIAKRLVKAKIGDIPGVTVTEDTQTIIR